MDMDVIEATKKEISRLMEAGQYEDALPMIRQAAHWGDVESQMLAADIYLEGRYGMRPNPYAAFDYVKLAALNDQPYYMYELGKMFAEGRGTRQDEDKAFYFLQKAAQRDIQEAYDPLSMMYLLGKGTEKNLEKAAEWNAKAAAADPHNETTVRHSAMIQKIKSEI